MAYVRIPAFQKTTAADLEDALWDLHRQGMRSLIIDLRGNPGGLLTASVEVADKFIADGGIVSTRGRSEQENFNYRAHRPGTWRVPLVVLIDGDSASASEIFAGAIKDSGRGKIVGTRSYGKGSVQGIFPLGTNGAGARLTTATLLLPARPPDQQRRNNARYRRASCYAGGQWGGDCRHEQLRDGLPRHGTLWVRRRQRLARQLRRYQARLPPTRSQPRRVTPHSRSPSTPPAKSRSRSCKKSC